jgi:anti-anti-sigma regulatory factor
MLRITTAEKEDSIVFSIEGRLCGAWAEEARGEWQRLRERVNSHPIVLDLAGVTYVDRAGESLLAEILSAGARVHANGVLISHIVERVRTQVPPHSVE